MGSFQPNRFGLYDMSGNVWQWVEDCYDQDFAGAPGNGAARESCSTQYRVLRGGSWRDITGVRSATRGHFGAPDGDVGFRLARTD